MTSVAATTPAVAATVSITGAISPFAACAITCALVSADPTEHPEQKRHNSKNEQRYPRIGSDVLEPLLWITQHPVLVRHQKSPRTAYSKDGTP